MSHFIDLQGGLHWLDNDDDAPEHLPKGYRKISEEEAAEITAKNNEISSEREREIVTANRQHAYMHESDPIMAKWLRGEATEKEWHDKIADIKTRFPYNEAL